MSNIMSYNKPRTIITSFKGKAVMSIVLIIIIVLSIFAIVPVVAASQYDITGISVVPTDFTDGTKLESENWSFGVADYAESIDFTESDDFAAPTAVWNAGNPDITYSWNAVSEATVYKLYIYNAATSELVHKEEDLTDLTYQTGYGVIPAGDNTFLAQVIAFNGDKKISASEISSVEISNSGIVYSSYPYTGNKSVTVADSYESGTSKIHDTATGTYYSFGSQKGVTFHAKSGSGKRYGTYLTFTAPEDGIYDIMGGCFITNNNIADLTLNYRVVKIADGKQTVIWPLNADNDAWITEDIVAGALNPSIEDMAPQAELKKDEKIVIQTFITENSIAVELDIRLSNPTAVCRTKEETYKGEAVVYPFYDYCPLFYYNISREIIEDVNFNGRWRTYAIHKTDSVLEVMEQGRLGNYGFHVVRKSSSEAIYFGYKIYTDGSGNNPLLNLAKDYGTSFDFTVPSDGKITLSSGVFGNDVEGTKYRVLHIANDGTINTLSEGEWVTVLSGTTDISATVYANKGDIISLQFLGNDAVETGYYRACLIMPTVTMATGSEANSSTDETFSPLWERPYSGKDYNGKFVPLDGAVWQFGFTSLTQGERKKLYYQANRYNSENNELYIDKYDLGLASNKIPVGYESSYLFEDDELQLKLNNSKDVVSLAYITPQRGVYDFSTVVKMISGGGTGYVRILKNDVNISPWSDKTTADWYEFGEFTTDDPISLDAMELSCNRGDVIRLEIYVNKDQVDKDGDGEKDDGWEEPTYVSLGTPVVQRLNNRTATDYGNITVYTPQDYTAFESGYEGEFNQFNSRYTYYFETENGVNAVNKTVSSTKTLSNGQNSVTFSDEVSFNLKAGTTAYVDFNSPMDGEGEIKLKAAVDSGTVKYALKNADEWVFDKQSNLPESCNISIENGDVLRLYIIAETDAKLSFSEMNLALMGEHNNQNNETDDNYFAVYANLYDNDEYTGDVKYSESSYWQFGVYDVKNDEIKLTNYYEDTEKKLYNKDLANTGYTFASQKIEANLHSKDYGMALGFKAPRDDTFSLRSGFNLVTDETVEFKMRLVKVDTEGNTTNLYPTDLEWQTVSAVKDSSVAVPYISCELNAGEQIFLQFYFETASLNDISVNLSSPAVIKETPTLYTNEDCGVETYFAAYYTPYANIYPYNSTYIHMDNRWNFEFVSVNSDNEVVSVEKPLTIRNTGSVDDLEYRMAPACIARHRLLNKQDNMLLAINKNDNFGSQLRFISPKDGTYIFNAAPRYSSIEKGVTLRYQVLKRDSSGRETVVWPLEGNGEYEILDSENLVSQGNEVSVELKAGEEIIARHYIERNYTVEEMIENSNDNFVSMSTGITPSASIVTVFDEDKTNFSSTQGFLENIMLSPYWRYEYSLDCENVKWMPLSSFEWGGWYAPSPIRNLSVNNLARMRVQNANNSLVGTHPVVCIKFIVPRDGYITMSNTQTASKNGGNLETGRARITLNNENVYPESGWGKIPFSTKDVQFEVKKGDEVRFEVSPEEGFKTDDDAYLQILWNASFTLDAFKSYYTQTEDIYNMLDADSLVMFKSMKSIEFDTDPQATKALSDAIAKRKEDSLNYGKLNNTDEEVKNDSNEELISDSNEEYDSNEEFISDSYGEFSDLDNTQDDYSEWTETVITPGGGYKKIRRIYYTAWWIYALIGGGAAVIIATIVVLIILKKKGKIFTKKVKEDLKEEK